MASSARTRQDRAQRTRSRRPCARTPRSERRDSGPALSSGGAGAAGGRAAGGLAGAGVATGAGVGVPVRTTGAGVGEGVAVGVGVGAGGAGGSGAGCCPAEPDPARDGRHAARVEQEEHVEPGGATSAPAGAVELDRAVAAGRSIGERHVALVHVVGVGDAPGATRTARVDVRAGVGDVEGRRRRRPPPAPA